MSGTPKTRRKAAVFRNLLLASGGLALIILLAQPYLALAEEPPKSTEFGRVFEPFDATLHKGRNRLQVEAPDFDVAPRYYRLRFHVKNPDRSPWTVTVRTPGGQLLSTFDQSDERCEADTGCWSLRLGTSLPTIRFDTASPNARLEIPIGLYMPTKAKKSFYSHMPGNEAKKIVELSLPDEDEKSALQDKAENLGMFIGSGPGKDGNKVNWCCSGVRLTADLFMTNWHCGAAEGMQDSAFWNTSGAFNSCQASLVDLSWDQDLQGREYACRSIEFADKTLDVAILRLGKLADGPPLTRPLSSPVLSNQRAAAGSEITVLHHPACEPKSVTRGCRVKDPAVPSWTDGAQKTDFSHGCTTESGSSGGPVYAADGTVVGLHHLGVKEGLPERANYAVGTDAILAALKQRKPALFQEITGTAP